eukprot:TRINITY_DN2884_c0_g1_i12.p1 TRINITY_DN2884_c0_g1~~TRINITY_DN2884_c0_g1_i12.p1  ORF type:complete len:202 (-),score=33.74 TRINITY_DN2884_c0_g1_i12:128-733(-)
MIQMKSLLLFVGLLSLSSCIPLIEFPKGGFHYTRPEHDPAEFIKGLVESWRANGENVEKMLLCSSNVFHIEEYIRIIQKALKDLGSGDITVVIRSLKIVLENVEEIIDSLIPCVESMAEFKVMLDRVTHLEPIEFLWRCFNNLMNNTETIQKDVQNIIDGCKKGDSYKVGYNYGEIVHIIVFKHQPHLDLKAQMRDFFKRY